MSTDFSDDQIVPDIILNPEITPPFHLPGDISITVPDILTLSHSDEEDGSNVPQYPPEVPSLPELPHLPDNWL